MTTQADELSSRGWLSDEELQTLEYVHILERFYPNESYDEAHNLQPSQPRSESVAYTLKYLPCRYLIILWCRGIVFHMHNMTFYT